MTAEIELGYTCACPDGYGLEADGFECKGLVFFFIDDLSIIMHF